MPQDYNNKLTQRFEAMLRTNKSYFFDVDEFLDIIDEYIVMANYNMAYKAIEIGLQQHHQSVDIQLYKAELYALDDQLDKAMQLLKELQNQEPDRIEIPMLEAELFSRKHMHREAIAALQKALDLPDHDPQEIYELMTVEYLYLDDYRSALNTALESLRLNPASSTSLYNAITCYDLLDEADKATAFLEEYVDKNPFSEIAWSLLAKKYINQEAYNKALKAIEFAIAIDDRFLGAYYDKAYIYNKLKQYTKALECYRQTLKIADPTAFTYYHMARIYEKINDYNQAAEYYLLAIAEDPGHYKSWIRVVQIKIRINDLDGALDIAKKALEIVNNQELFVLLADIYVLKNDLYKAIPALEMSLKLGEKKLDIILKLADLYKQTHKVEKFRQLLLDAKKAYPDSQEIKKRMLGQ